MTNRILSSRWAKTAAFLVCLPPTLDGREYLIHAGTVASGAGKPACITRT